MTAEVGTLALPEQSPTSAAAGAQPALHFVVNDASGSHDDAPLMAALQTVLEAAGRRYELHRAGDPSKLADTAAQAARAAQQGAAGSIVVAVGGDGSINTVASAVLQAAAQDGSGGGTALGIVPRGTFNYFARAHGIPLDAESAMRLLLTGVPQPVQVGRVNDRVFLVNASLGLYPELLEDREAFKQRFGRTRLVALGAALRSLLRDHRRLVLHVDGDAVAPRQLKVSTLFVCNNRLQIEQLGLPEADGTGSTALVALALRSVRPAELLWLAVRGALGQLGDADDLQHFAFKQLAVQPPGQRGLRPIKAAVDGEVTTLQPPLMFAVGQRPLMLVKPAPGAAEAPRPGADSAGG